MIDLGVETGVDCGGSCYPCFPSQNCDEASDCFHGVCDTGVCALPTDSDGVQNDNETGLDCGCDSCALCAEGFGCVSGEDCQSLVCWAGKCQGPKCTDGIQNGDEVGVDCGGPCSTCL